MYSGLRQALVACTLVGVTSIAVTAQDQIGHQHTATLAEPEPQGVNGMHDMDGMPGMGWRFMQDGVVNGFFNHQGGPAGGSEVKVSNWWMGMASRSVGRRQLTLTGMFSLDPATVGKRGYGELFQLGEALDGAPVVDRQHPHDLFMQLGAGWRSPLSSTTSLTIKGGPVGEPALGPVAFMHRASADGLPIAPLSHHTFDATHIAFGVATATVDRGRWSAEASVFNGREPDDNRWNFDFGRLDSMSARVWFRPTPSWSLQVSTGRLVSPEALHPGNLVRTTASASWLRTADGDFQALTVGYGMNVEPDVTRRAVFAEWARQRGTLTVSSRLELVQVDTETLMGQSGSAHMNSPNASSLVGALTLGGVRRIVERRGLEGGLGVNATCYGVPAELRATHGAQPLSLQVFLRVRPLAIATGRQMRMAR